MAFITFIKLTFDSFHSDECIQIFYFSCACITKFYFGDIIDGTKIEIKSLKILILSLKSNLDSIKYQVSENQ